MKILLTTLLVFFTSLTFGQKKKTEVTCPTYSNATIVTYRWKKGTPKNCLNKKAKEDYLILSRKNKSVVHHQSKRGRFINDRKKTQKKLLNVGMIKRRKR